MRALRTIMNAYSQKSNKASGFTLVEFIITMTVTAVLGGIVLPVGRNLIIKAQMEADRQKMQYLALSCGTAIAEGRLNLSCVHDMPSFAQALAEAGVADKITFYQSSRRKTPSVGDPNRPLSEYQKEDFDFILVAPHKGKPIPGQPLKYGISDATTPICYSRGLQPNGKWDPDSLYGSKQGLIAFMDGHVEKFGEKVDDGLLNFLF